MDERYRALTAKVDGFFARVHARHGDDMQCGSGCADCCHTRLTVTGVEAHAIAELVGEMPAEARAELAALAARPVGDVAGGGVRCAALGDDDRCRIYAARPIVCRSHGAPIRLGKDVTACHRNFRAHGPASADADCILDQTTLSALVLAVDREHAGATRSAREDLAALLARLTS
jgi:uncharacterized protein